MALGGGWVSPRLRRQIESRETSYSKRKNRCDEGKMWLRMKDKDGATLPLKCWIIVSKYNEGRGLNWLWSQSTGAPLPIRHEVCVQVPVLLWIESYEGMDSILWSNVP